jgi:hypothetical protein
MLACGPSAADIAQAGFGRSPSRATASASAGSPSCEEAPCSWAVSTTSPQLARQPLLDLGGCAGYDSALTAVAARVAQRRASGQRALEISEVVAALRAAGSPHVWPKVWTLSGQALDPAAVEAAVVGSLADGVLLGERRCGVARERALAGADVYAVISVDVVADLSPLPSRARLGQWLELDAKVLTEDTGVRVVLLGPRGAPKTVPSRLSQGKLRAAFSVDHAGLWRVQAVIDSAVGPRPALEAWVFVDERPNAAAAAQPAPGESLGLQATGADPNVDLRRLLFEMVTLARRSEGLLPLVRDDHLDMLAQAHAEGMRRARRAAHDTGDGLPTERAERADVSAQRIGENVARASSLGRAHRALWDSPSHRGNLLDPSFEAIGLGVAVDPVTGESAGTAPDLWVVELFADYGTTGRAVLQRTSQPHRSAVIGIANEVP